MTMFYLGTGRPGWLGTMDVPLMVSRRQLARYRVLPRARAPWLLDSGGFTELGRHGRWTITAAEYVAVVRRYALEVGRLAWAAPQDWMVEPSMVARTGLTVAEHQRRTVDNLLELRGLAPDLPFVPVVQGWTPDDYRRCHELYAAAGVELELEPVVGVGSVCRRRSSEHAAAEQAIRWLQPRCGSLHGFGVSLEGLARYADALGSCDSQAWSSRGRYGCEHRADCSRPVARHGGGYLPRNCPGCALAYRAHLLGGGARPTLFTSSMKAAA